LTTDPTRPWLSKLVGEGLSEAERSLGELTTLASSWLGTFLRSIWSGGRALISIFSLAVVTPIVAFYLVYDWNRMIAVIDNWVPPARRDTVRALAREVDDTISGFVRGQSALCLVLAIYYACAVADRPQARFGDRLCGGLAKLHPVSRLTLRSCSLCVRALPGRTTG
jgi:predicted PurR-regulated permease PerM